MEDPPHPTPNPPQSLLPPPPPPPPPTHTKKKKSKKEFLIDKYRNGYLKTFIK